MGETGYNEVFDGGYRTLIYGPVIEEETPYSTEFMSIPIQNMTYDEIINLTDEEYNNLTQNMTDEEMELLIQQHNQ